MSPWVTAPAALAITGIGAVSAAGRGARALWEAMRHRRSFLAPVGRLEAGRLLLPRGGAVSEEVLGKSDDRLHAMCALACEEALGDGGTPAGPIGISLGTALGSVEELEALAGAELRGDDLTERARRARRAVPHHDLTERLAARFNLRGPRSTFSMTCASGLCALEQAASDLRLGRSGAMVVGGADLLSRFMQAGFTALKALSPTGCLRPFEKAHDGIVLGEAAAFVLLEPIAAARARGARVRALLCGNRLLSDASHLTSPDESGAGMGLAIRLALEEAQVAPREVGGITVTATGSPVYDRMQCRAIRAALGPAVDRIPVSTWETCIGHALGSTAILGLVHAAQALEEKVLLGVGGAGELDPDSRLRYLFEGPAPLTGRAVLALTVGFGGQNGATVITHGEDGP